MHVRRALQALYASNSALEAARPVDIEVGGIAADARLSAGETVCLAICSANVDPASLN